MNREKMRAAGAQNGAAALGALPAAVFFPLLSEQQRARLEHLEREPQSVLIVAFPYWAGNAPGNIALYARGEDYVRANRRRLTALGQTLALPWFYAAGNAWPLPAVRAAALAGVGRQGLHGLLIVPPYGSYVTLGALFTDAVLPETSAAAGACTGCRACVRACPTGALTVREGRGILTRERCLSHITQKKDPLSPEEEALVRGAARATGCDLCQLACPENRDAQRTALPEFTQDLLPQLSIRQSETRDLSGRAYGGSRLAPLLRNLRLREENSPPLENRPEP